MAGTATMRGAATAIVTGEAASIRCAERSCLPSENLRRTICGAVPARVILQLKSAMAEKLSVPSGDKKLHRDGAWREQI
jgi:hypothetical protein